jgi:DNA-binding LytR/AlgR family response regulator
VEHRLSECPLPDLQPTFNGEYAVFLHSGVKLTLSRGYRDALRTRLGADW